jgi:hypothetical protein
VWFILYVPTHITSNQHNTGTTISNYAGFTTISTQYPHVDHNTIFTVDLPPCGCSEAVLDRQPWLTAKSGLETFTKFVNFHCKHPFSHT